MKYLLKIVKKRAVISSSFTIFILHDVSAYSNVNEIIFIIFKSYNFENNEILIGRFINRGKY